MTNLRDARLQRALDHAPDAQLSPSALVRENIKKIASNQAKTGAIAQFDTQLPWWTRWWRASGQARGPWSAAMATVLLGGIITLIWRDQEVPGAAPQNKVAQMPEAVQAASAAKAEAPEIAKAAPAAANAPNAAMPPVAAKAPPRNRSELASAPAPKAALADRAQQTDATPLVLRQPPQAPQPKSEPSAMAQQAPAPAMTTNPSANVRADKSTSAAPSSASDVAAAAAPLAPPAPIAAPVAPSPTAPSFRAAAPIAQARAQASLSAGASPPTALAMAPAPAPPMVLGSVARARLSEVAAPAIVPDDWTEVDLQMPQRTRRWRKGDEPAFIARSLALVRTGSTIESAAPRVAFDAPPLLRLHWRQGSNTLATLELWADRYRLRRPGQPDLQGDTSEAEVAGIVAQAAVQ